MSGGPTIDTVGAGPAAPQAEAPATAGDPAWGLRHVEVRFGHRVALAGVSLHAPAGAVTAVVGGDGAGKSTLLRTLAGLHAPAAGRVMRPPAGDVGFVSAGAGAYDDLTVTENLDFVAGAYGLLGAQLETRAAPLLARAGLDAARDRLAGHLSGGMRQKLAFVLAAVHDPALLVLDEPTTGVDPVSRADIWRLIAGAAAAGTAVVMATTYLDEAERAATVLVLDDGRVLAAGTPDEIVARLPGRVVETVAAAGPGGWAAWPRGRHLHLWLPPAAPDRAATAPAAPAGALPVTADLTDAVIVAALARGGAGSPSNEGAAATAAAAPHAPTSPLPTRGDETALAATRGVTRRFGDFVAVDGVDLTVRPGETVGLLGANGAGKTTLIRLLLGLLRPSAGAVDLFGAPPSRAGRLRLGYVPQSLGVWDDLTVDENLAFSRRAFADPAAPAHECAAAPDAELAARGGALVRDLPLGLRRRLAFAAALAHRPELLVLDEPTSGVAALARARLWETIQGAAAGGAGVLVTTHAMDEAEQCDRLVLMAAGRVVAAGTIADIVGDATTVEVEAERWDDAFRALDDAGLPTALSGRRVRVAGGDAERVAAALDARRVAAHLRVVPASFDEAFVELVSAAAPASADGSTAAVTASPADRPAASPATPLTDRHTDDPGRTA